MGSRGALGWSLSCLLCIRWFHLGRGLEGGLTFDWGKGGIISGEVHWLELAPTCQLPAVQLRKPSWGHLIHVHLYESFLDINLMLISLLCIISGSVSGAAPQLGVAPTSLPPAVPHPICLRAISLLHYHCRHNRLPPALAAMKHPPLLELAAKGALGPTNQAIVTRSHVLYVRRCLVVPVLWRSISWYTVVSGGISVFCVLRALNDRTICKYFNRFICAKKSHIYEPILPLGNKKLRAFIFFLGGGRGPNLLT